MKVKVLRRNKVGPTTELCGTSASMMNVSEAQPSKRTLIFLLLKNELRRGQRIERPFTNKNIRKYTKKKHFNFCIEFIIFKNFGQM